MSAAQITKAGAAVSVVHASKRFGDVKALCDVSLAIGSGLLQCLIGPAGAGKSTLLRCIGGIETVDDGAIQIDGKPIGQPGIDRCDAIGMIQQHLALFDHMTALQHVIEGPLALLRRSRRDMVTEAMAALERVGLADRRDSYPSELSGGQRHCLAVARELAAKPRLLLLDEPTAGLDREAGREVLNVMRELAGSGLTLIVATHELGFVRDVADDVAFMDGGVIVEQGPSQSVLSAPKQMRMRDFLASLSA